MYPLVSHWLSLGNSSPTPSSDGEQWTQPNDCLLVQPHCKDLRPHSVQNLLSINITVSGVVLKTLTSYWLDPEFDMMDSNQSGFSLYSVSCFSRKLK